ncbi:reverse transcriptase domain-containing protein [Tanacetum coccineum]
MIPIYNYLTEETLPAEKEKARAVRRKSGGYAVINEVLYKKFYLGPWLRCVGPLQANYVLREILEGSYSMHAGTRFVVAKAIRIGYYDHNAADQDDDLGMSRFAMLHRPVPRNPQQKLTPIMSPWPFYKWGINIADPFPEGVGKVKFLIVAIDYFTKWIKAKPVATITALEINLDLLEERKEQAAIREARSKAKMEKYYNSKVHNTIFKPGDLVYRNNDASHAKDSGKLSPKWEGPYEVMEALGNGAYKLRDRSGKLLPRTWNVRNLKKCYVHEM